MSPPKCPSATNANRTDRHAFVEDCRPCYERSTSGGGLMRRVEDRVAVVTGAASGIGLGIARAFAAAGMKVVLADVREEPLERAAAELRDGGGRAIAVRTDVARLEEVEALAAATLAEFGAVHVLCNNAGVGLFTRIADTSIDDWRWTLEIDLWGPIHGVKTFLPIIEREDEGHINSTSSMAGLVAVPRLGAYNVAKHGVVALMATLERELRAAHSPVRTSVLCPGPVNTGIVANSAQSRRHVTGSPDSAWEPVDAIGAGADPDDVGRLVLDAIRDDRFWIFTAPDLIATVQHQVTLMAEEQSLSRLRLG
jgi:NAD(P)-dependent dehydrogenase (short-subunit alcohol dehydrogenase family)